MKKKGAASRVALLIGDKVKPSVIARIFFAQVVLEPFSGWGLYFLEVLPLTTLTVSSFNQACGAFAWVLGGVVVAGKEIHYRVVPLLQTDSDCSFTLVTLSAFVFPSALTSLPRTCCRKISLAFAVRQTHRWVWRPKSSVFVCKDCLPVGLGISLFPDPPLHCRWIQWDHRVPDHSILQRIVRELVISVSGWRGYLYLTSKCHQTRVSILLDTSFTNCFTTRAGPPRPRSPWDFIDRETRSRSRFQKCNHVKLFYGVNLWLYGPSVNIGTDNTHIN